MPWLPELFAMAEDMRVLDEMLADGGLKLGSEEVEAYKYNYRYNYKYNYSTGITTTITTTCITKSITTGIKLLAIQYKYNYRNMRQLLARFETYVDQLQFR